MSKITLAVTTDLNYDQRMIRICTSLHETGYEVELVGIAFPHSKALTERPYQQTRIPIPYSQGKMMYLLYWWKLFFYLLKNKAQVFVAIDLDTILSVYFASVIKRTKRVYDAHEIFTEMQEVNERPFIKKMWEIIGGFCIPRFKKGYTIGEAYAEFFKEKYKVSYEVVRNATVYKEVEPIAKKEKYILYQGAVNKGRAFEQLIPAMKKVDAPLWIIGKGNFSEQVKALIQTYQLEDKVKLLGYIPPQELKQYTQQAYIGITLFDSSNNGLSNKLSMANRFFDYMHSGIPQLCSDYPEYRKVNEKWQLAYLVKELSPEQIAQGLNELLHNESLYREMAEQAKAASQTLCWQEEEKKLIQFYATLKNEK